MQQTIAKELGTCLEEFSNLGYAKQGEIFLVGCSTSEVIGKEIGTSGTMEVAEVIYKQLATFRQKTDMHLAFQCCEHINRAIVVEREIAEKFQLELVTVIPVAQAGGALAAYAYTQMKNPVVVEHIRAYSGMDIGDTFIGMHLKHVAVPVRTSVREIGQAHVSMAISRPKLIGGARGVYQV